MSTKHRITFTVVLALLALLVLGTGLVLAEGEAPAAPLIQLEHNPEIRDLRVLSCDNTPTNELPQELEVVRYQGPEIGVVTSTLDLIWSEDGGCFTTQSFGGSFGVRRIKLPQAIWNLGFFGPFSDYYWDVVPGVSWNRTVENPALLLQHDVQNDQLRMIGCGLPDSSLPSTGDMIQFGQDQEVGLEWNLVNQGMFANCYTTYGLGGTGALGISEVSVPSGPWNLSFYNELSGDLWQTDGSTTWSQAPIQVTLTDALGRWIDPQTDLQVGNWVTVTLAVSTTVPTEYWGKFTFGGSQVSVSPSTTVTLRLNGATNLGMDEGSLLSPITWSCSLTPCPADVVQGGLNMKSIPFNYGIEFVESAEEGFNYEFGIIPSWAERSVQATATLSWEGYGWTMCPEVRLEGWGKVVYQPSYWEGSTAQAAILTVQPGDWSTTISSIVGPADCVKERIFLPFALR